jgi:hypothetical protein
VPEITDPPAVRCSSLHSERGIEESQTLAPDLFSSGAPAREGNGRFAKGHSGNPAGRPRGIPNPKRRVPDLRALPRDPEALSDFLRRKPWLRRPLLAQLLPPARATDPAERLGISVEKLRTAADFQRAMQTVCSAVAAGEVGPREAGRLARRVRTQMRALRRLARIQRRLARPAGSSTHLNGE